MLVQCNMHAQPRTKRPRKRRLHYFAFVNDLKSNKSLRGSDRFYKTSRSVIYLPQFVEQRYLDKEIYKKHRNVGQMVISTGSYSIQEKQSKHLHILETDESGRVNSCA